MPAHSISVENRRRLTGIGPDYPPYINRLRRDHDPKTQAVVIGTFRIDADTGPVFLHGAAIVEKDDA